VRVAILDTNVDIALTARRCGATVVTGDRKDFELLARFVRISVLPLA